MLKNTELILHEMCLPKNRKDYKNYVNYSVIKLKIKK